MNLQKFKRGKEEKEGIKMDKEKKGKIEKFEEIKITATDITKFLCPTATEKEVYMALNIIKSYSLNPFKREVHIIKYGNSPAQVIVGYEVYLKRAERTGQLNGWDVTADENSATCTIYRKDWDKPLVWTVAKAEFDKGQAIWKSMPEFMLKKVAIAQAFRLAFPDELGGMPYTREEVDTFMPVPTSSKPEVAPPQEIAKEPEPEQTTPAVPLVDNLIDFNNQKEGEKFNVLGVVMEWLEKKTKTKRDMTTYVLSLQIDSETEDMVEINKMGTASKGISVGERVIFEGVSYKVMSNGKLYYWMDKITKANGEA